MKKVIFKTLIFSLLVFISCDKEDSDSPVPIKQLMKFSYENTTYDWQVNGINGTVTYMHLGNLYTINAGCNDGTLIIAKKGEFKVGEKYDIMSDDESDIQISLSLGETIAMSYFGDGAKVGEITITSDTKEMITGIFNCNMKENLTTDTKITNGSFRALKTFTK